MKNSTLRGITLSLLVILCQQLFANKIIVKGHIRNSNGTAVAGRLVTVSIDSTLNPDCIQYHFLYSNDDGFYTDTLTCNGDIQQVIISTVDCNGELLIHKEETTNDIIESNFTICNAPSTCNAAFDLWKDSLNLKLIHVHAPENASENDSVIERIWIWSDGDTLNENNVSASHEYKEDGVYSVCLKIKTEKACTSTYCDSIEILSKCKAKFEYSSLPLTADGYGLKVYSNMSFVVAGDSVIKRVWKWGDETKTENVDSISTSHYYKNTGSYNVCLFIQTKNGCSDTTCTSINIPVDGFHCNASFVYSIDNNKIKFDSHESNPGLYDTINSRAWSFGDSTYADGNIIDPVHEYKDTGWYYTCLNIKTKYGCENTTCEYVRIEKQHEAECSAKFEYDLLNDYGVKFNSSMSDAADGDSIIYRVWHWGDSTAEDGNYVDPTHYYSEPGEYYTCLTIKTKKGCENTTCKYVRIEKKSETECVAKFEYDLLDDYGVKFNSSMSSAADGDSIIQRIWHWGDGAAEDGNHVDPTHYYTHSGEYEVCLTIKTKKSCFDSICSYIKIESHETSCNASFTFIIDSNIVKFNSDQSRAGNEDSIISRRWDFGDSTNHEGNSIDPAHVYMHPGIYHVCLTIKTTRGCEKTECKEIAIKEDSGYCIAAFAGEKISENKFRFNSNISSVSEKDSIISRTWHFGDGTSQDGNHIDPTHYYNHGGEYNVCLTIKTLKGCKQEKCTVISVDSLHNEGEIANLYPNPATTQLTAVIRSNNNNVQCMLTVLNIYGQKQSAVSKVLMQGDNLISVYTANLVAGAYFLRITTVYGNQSRMFFKE